MTTDLSIFKETDLEGLVSPVTFSLSADTTAQEALDTIRSNHTVRYVLYITDENGRLTGTVKLSDLLIADPEQTLGEIREDHQLITAGLHEDREEIAEKFKDYDLLSLPVTDENGVLIGMIEYDDAIDILREETTEDFEKMAAISAQDKPYLITSDFKMAKSRIVWLLVLMLSSILTGDIITRYENAFVTMPILISFIPMLMDTGGNCGSQSSTIVIRGITTKELRFRDFFAVVFKEFKISILVSAVLAFVNGIRILIQYHDPLLALTIVLSLVITVVFAKLLGAALPMLADKIGIDPATMASPLITTIVDTCSVLIYFRFACIIFKL